MRSPWLIPEIASGEFEESDLGGAKAHSSRSGVACLVAEDEQHAFELANHILSYLPDNTDSIPPRFSPADDPLRLCEDLGTLVPNDPNRPYDMRGVIETVVDDSTFMELFPDYAENIIIGFSRLDGQPIGVIGNQPSVLAGCLDIDASIKAARFIRTCDVFNLPLLTFVDVPGFLPGTVQEWGGIIRHGAKLLYAYAEATVPKMTVVTRKAYGGLPSNVLQEPQIRCESRLAIRGVGSDGCRGCRPHHPQEGPRRVRGPRGHVLPPGRGVQGQVRRPLRQPDTDGWTM